MRISRVSFVFAIGATLCTALTACSLDHLLNGDDQTEGTVVDPGTLSTYHGALTIYNAARLSMLDAMNVAVPDVGLMTDELTTISGVSLEVDGRYIFSDQGREGLTSSAYEHFQATRVSAAQAVELLRRYGTDASSALIGNAYAMQAYAIMMLAEMYCSGVPLTEAPFQGKLKYTPGLSTTTLFERAVALFDTAYQYGKDSIPIATFAQVGKGRALLSLGRYTEAAAAVTNVSPNSTYGLSYTNQQGGFAFWTTNSTTVNRYRIIPSEGGNGIQWLASTPALQDKRVPVTSSGEVFVDPVRQKKYTLPTMTFIVTNHIQALMIAAEAQLQPANNPQGPWLATLNDARATIGLAALSDPGTAAERIDLLFQERAFWFYLTGQRLGDMRRLVRYYGRLPDKVYPTGAHPAANPYNPVYGNEFVFIPPKTEQEFNPLFTGCIDKRP